MEPYIETQSFNQPFIKIVFLITFLTTISGVIWGEPKENDTTKLIIAFAIMGGVAALMYLAKLNTRIDESGIKIRFYPFQRVTYFVAWNEIESAYVRKYKPLMEYGGWGLRYSIRNGKAFNVSGNTGLQLVLKSGKKFLIGTQKEEQLNKYLTDLKSRYAITCIK